MLFEFQLRPIEKVVPWGNEGDYSLGWFGLTDGWHWLQCGEEELFRYSDSVLASGKYEGRQQSDPPYADYQVVRLWEDVLDMLPDVLSPVPLNLLDKIQPGLEADSWIDRVFEFAFPEGCETSQSTENKFDAVTEWLGQRRLDSGYLKQGPRIWLWSDGKNVFVRWDNAGLVLDGHEMWTAQSGTYSLPLEEFIEEVRSFDRRLIAAMNERVQSIRQHWNRPEIRIDKEALLVEQEQRSQWLNEALERLKTTEPPDWNRVIDAISYFEKMGYPIR